MLSLGALLVAAPGCMESAEVGSMPKLRKTKDELEAENSVKPHAKGKSKRN